MKCYKAINSDGGSVASFGKANVQYIPKEEASTLEVNPYGAVEAPAWLAAQGYYLLAFDTIEHALYAYHADISIGGVQLWEAEGEEPIEKLPQRASVIAIQHGELELFNDPLDWPYGTLMFKRLRVTKRIIPEITQEEEDAAWLAKGG